MVCGTAFGKKVDGLNSLKLTHDSQRAESVCVVMPAAVAVPACRYCSPQPAAVTVPAATAAVTADWQSLQIALGGCHNVIAEGQENWPAHGCYATGAHKEDGGTRQEEQGVGQLQQVFGLLL